MSHQADPVRLAWWNVANAANDEKVPEWRFGARLGAVCDAIAEQQPTVLSLLELRVCADESGAGRLTPASILSQISQRTGMAVADLRPRNLGEMAFWQGMLYDARRLRHTGSQAEWAVPPVFGSDRVEDRGVLVLFCEFEQIGGGSDGPRRFTVASTHFPLELPEKLKAARWLAGWAKTREQPCFLGGDLNTFTDAPAEGTQVLDALCAADDAGQAPAWERISVEATPTFTSFPHDRWQGSSTLDHAVALDVPGWEKAGPSRAVRCASASDHYMLQVDLTIEIPSCLTFQLSPTPTDALAQFATALGVPVPRSITAASRLVFGHVRQAQLRQGDRCLVTPELRLLLLPEDFTGADTTTSVPARVIASLARRHMVADTTEQSLGRLTLSE